MFTVMIWCHFIKDFKHHNIYMEFIVRFHTAVFPTLNF